MFDKSMGTTFTTTTRLIYSTIFMKKFSGFWSHDKKNGPGKSLSEDGVQYNGDYKDNERHGYGVSVDLNGKYIGYWSHDIKDREGVESIYIMFRVCLCVCVCLCRVKG